MSHKIYPTNELSSALLCNFMNEEQIAFFIADPKGVIFSGLNFDVGDTEINIVHNSSAEVHLSLPYYSGLEAISAELISDQNLEEIQGGEIASTVFSVIVLAVSAAGVIGMLGYGLAGIAEAMMGEEEFKKSMGK